ncbi:UPF0481 protein At3g47200-like [Ziziphus jujuba]|uniref:UPF0481 protein At3g47200-like n=2 Tax=Ziziphus jujuba TaxID=326968 RepID=A0A6P4AXE3_ZIZJJ|nr:UPF0481 protein At3g47200-like [Ziziphus jujuba]
MAARDESLLFTEELSAKRTIIRENPEGSSRQTNDPELLSIVIQQVGSSCATSSSSVVSSTDEWLKSIGNAVLTDSSSSAGNNNKKQQVPKIAKVPDVLRNIESNKDCYDPMVVSIGPYHHGKPHLQEIEELKIKWANQFVADIDDKAQSDHLEKVKKLYKEVEKVADKAREYYYIDMEDNEKFTRMMFLDGCFILQYLVLLKDADKRTKMGMKTHQAAYVQRDLFLLENQLPYIVLEALMSIRFKKAGEGKKMIDEFIQLTQSLPPKPTSWLNRNFRFGSSSRPKSQASAKSRGDIKAADHTEEGSNKPHQDVHLLDLLRTKLVEPDSLNADRKKKLREFIQSVDAKSKTYQWFSYGSAKELKNVGIRFKANESGSFSDVHFASGFLLSGNLTLPPLTVDDSTKSMLLNLVAFEMSPDGPDDFGVTSYICLMDSLLDNVEDVFEMRSHDILMNYLGSDQQVADLFNDISKNLIAHPDAYYDVKFRIEEHYKNRVKIWMAEWLHTHFSSPWTVLAFLGAIFAIALSFIQTYLAIKPVKSGP